MSWTPPYVVALVAAAACGSDVDTLGGGGSGAGASSGDAGGGWTDCSSPSGYRICHGPANCTTDEDCGCSSDVLGGPEGQLGVCTSTVYEWTLSSTPCPDGGLYFQGIGVCMPWEVGMLYCNAGDVETFFYLDGMPFDCRELPHPSDCPAVDAPLTLCGDSCGPCGPKERCAGRTQLHPYGFCAPDPSNVCLKGQATCEPDEACMIYTVDNAHQSSADKLGLCLPLALCDAVASSLPGGASCDVP